MLSLPLTFLAASAGAADPPNLTLAFERTDRCPLEGGGRYPIHSLGARWVAELPPPWLANARSAATPLRCDTAATPVLAAFEAHATTDGQWTASERAELNRLRAIDLALRQLVGNSATSVDDCKPPASEVDPLTPVLTLELDADGAGLRQVRLIDGAGAVAANQAEQGGDAWTLAVPAGALPTESLPALLGRHQIRIDLDAVARDAAFEHWTAEVDVTDARPLERLLGRDASGWRRQELVLGTSRFLTLAVPVAELGKIAAIERRRGVRSMQQDVCRSAQMPSLAAVSDSSVGSWASHRIRSKPEHLPALSDTGTVLVALLSTGLDRTHPNLDAARLWRNAAERDGVAGRDDDDNGLVDDVSGWDFVNAVPDVSDPLGYGTAAAGVLAGQDDVADIGRIATILPLKITDDFGNARASTIADALLHSAIVGARISVLGVALGESTHIERAAIGVAASTGMLVIAPAGNDNAELAAEPPGLADRLLTVASSSSDDLRSVFSNWGAAVDLAAPGTDVATIHARRAGGSAATYALASGTSIAAAFGGGAAAWLVAAEPGLSNTTLMRMLKNSARDIDQPGIDHTTGYGLVNTRAALDADPSFHIAAALHRIQVVKLRPGLAIRVFGTVDADRFKDASLQIGEGRHPGRWREVGTRLTTPIRDGVLAEIPTAYFRGATRWMIRSVVRHENGRSREARFELRVD